jgi:PDZ domain-containing protein
MTIFEQRDPTPGVQGRSARVGWLMLALTGVIVIGLSFFPAPYVIDNPGPTYDTLGSVTVGDGEFGLITISGQEVFETTGELRLTTVTRSGNPESLPGWMDVMAGWLDPTRTVIPVDVAYPPGVTVEQNREAAQIDMENSQQEAIAAALSYVGIPFTSTLVVNQALEGGPSEGVLLNGDVITSAEGEPVHTVTQLREIIAEAGISSAMALGVNRDGVEVDVAVVPRMSEGQSPIPVIGILVSGRYEFPLEIDIALENVGGPSAGLMFALGIVDKLEPQDLTGGHVVAGTGTINAQGEVGSIGGIRHKLYGAKNDGAEWFLAPAGNCPDVVGRIPEGLGVVAVATLDDAVDALTAISSGLVPTLCPGTEASAQALFVD